MSREEVTAALKDMRDGVTEVDLSKLGLSSQEVLDLCDALEACPTLLKLNLFDNSLGKDGLARVCHALKINTSVIDVDLSVNKAGDAGLDSVADLLTVDSTIIKLGYGGNGATPAGCGALADVLRTDVNLQILDLQFNALGAAGMAMLADALKSNTALLELYLGGNAIGDSGAVELAEMLKVNTSLQRLELPQNDIGVDGANALADSLDSNETLLALVLEDPGVPGAVKRKITDKLASIKQQADDFGYHGYKALERNHKVRWGRAKLMVVGDGGTAGKSATMRSLMGVPNRAGASGYEQQVEVDVRVTRVASDWTELKSEISDLSELLAKYNYTQQLAARSRASRRASRRVSRRYSYSDQKRESGRRSLKSKLTLGLLSSPRLAVSESALTRKFVSKLKARVEDRGEGIHSEVSFTVLDFVGQDLFYTLHHLFMTDHGVYMLCFSMGDLLADEKNAVKKLRFWLDSIKLHSPAAEVVMVGTHADKVPRERDVAVLSDKLESALRLSEHRVHRNGRLAFFPLDNMNPDKDGAVAAIRSALAASVRGKDYVEKQVPLRWALVADELGAFNDRSYMRLPLLKKFAFDRCGVSESELETQVLPFLRDVGIVLHRTETPALAERIVTRPQWVLDNLSRVLGDPAKRKLVDGNVYFGADFPPELEAAFDRWRTEGVADKALLGYMWRGKDYDFFSGLLETMHLACPSSNGSAYLIPALLPKMPAAELAAFEKLHRGGPLAYVQFTFLPTGIFHRFVVNLSAHEGGKTARVHHMYNDAVVLDMGGVQVLAQPRHSVHRVLLKFQRADAVAGNIAARMARIRASTGSVHTDFMRDKLQPHIFLSGDGTSNDNACASMEAVLAAAQAKGKKKKGAANIKTVAGRSLGLKSFAPFIG